MRDRAQCWSFWEDDGEAMILRTGFKLDTRNGFEIRGRCRDHSEGRHSLEIPLQTRFCKIRCSEYKKDLQVCRSTLFTTSTKNRFTGASSNGSHQHPNSTSAPNLFCSSRDLTWFFKFRIRDSKSCTAEMRSIKIDFTPRVPRAGEATVRRFFHVKWTFICRGLRITGGFLGFC